MIGDPRRHRGRHPKGSMNAAEIVVREVQRQGRFQVRQFLAERIGQPGKPPAHHADGQVLPFDVGRGDMPRIGIAGNRRGYRLRDLWWGVPPVPRRLRAYTLTNWAKSTSFPKNSSTAVR